MSEDRPEPKTHPGTRTIRARVEGGMLVPLVPLDLPDGTEILMRIEVPEPASNEPPIGSAAALLEAVRRGPKLEPGDIEALRDAIEEGRLDGGNARPGSPRALLEAMKRWPKIDPEAFDEIERGIVEEKRRRGGS